MSLEIARQSIAKSKSSEKPDQDDVQSAAQALRNITDTSPDPDHIKTGRAERDSAQHVNTPIPTMKGGKAAAHLRNQLSRSCEHDDDGRDQVHDHGPVALGHARQI